MTHFPVHPVTSIPHRTEWHKRRMWSPKVVEQDFEGFVHDTTNGDVYYLTLEKVIYIDQLTRMVKYSG